MPGNPSWTVAFAGPGMATKENVQGQLDNWIPNQVEQLILPDKITRGQRGLGNVAAYITGSFGNKSEGDDGFSTLPLGGMVGALQDARDQGHEVYLVLLWGDTGDEACEDLLEAAVEADIPCKDLTAGLDNLTWEGEEAEEPPDEPVTKPDGRTRRRRYPPPPAQEKPAEAVTEPRRRGKPRVAEPDDPTDPTAQVDMAFQELSLTPEKIAEVVDDRIRLSQINYLSLVMDALQAVHDTLKAQGQGPGRPRTRTEEDMKVAVWVDEQGHYQKRGRGKPPRGQAVVWLTPTQISELGLEVSS